MIPFVLFVMYGNTPDRSRTERPPNERGGCARRSSVATVADKPSRDRVLRKGRRICYLWMMDVAALLARIAAEPGKMGGKPVIRGRRISPSIVLTMLANGAGREAVLEAYPALTPRA